MTASIHSFIYDTADIAGLAAFYKNLLGFDEHYVGDDWITLEAGDGRQLCFQLADDHIPPQWPSQDAPQQFHLDLMAADMAGEVERAISLGATRKDGGGDTWTVLTDPSGHPFCICVSEKATGLQLYGLALDCPDGKALADFYAALLGAELTYAGPEGAAISAPEGHWGVMFQTVENYHAPRWPDPAYPQQGHLDIRVEDVDAAETRVLELGATRLPGGSGSGTDSGYRIFADPAGHPFCLVWGQ